METLQGLDVVRSAPVAVRAKDDAAMLEVRFSTFGDWYEIHSMWEGQFLEMVERGAFAKTIAESRDAIRVLFNHGFDPQIGDKVLGSIEDLREDDDAGVGVVRLFDTSYNRDLEPGLRAGVYGSSMKMRVIKDEWDDAPGRSDHNPDGIPERTIKEVRLMEFGPVTFPANPGATSSMRSDTDAYMERLRSLDPLRVDELTRARQDCTPRVVSAGSSTERSEEPQGKATTEPAAGHSAGLSAYDRRERIIQIHMRGE